MIRKALPSLVAQEIVGVQPMGLGPPVCDACMIIGKLDNHAKEHPWRCPRCGDFNLKGSLFTLISPTQQIVEIRTKIFESRMDTNMKVAKILHRKFMYPHDDREPNDRYRPWLEANVGKQGEMWNWDIAPTNTFDCLEISFAEAEHATLFELTCP